MKQRGENRYTILENGSFTPVRRAPTPSVVGSEVIHDREEQVAEIWNARFGLAQCRFSIDLQLPVGDKRRSGFLIPNAKYSTKNGVNSPAVLLEHRAKLRCHHYSALYEQTRRRDVGKRVPLSDPARQRLN
jgi:hypothetical protein